jgi:hypothetical protein
VLQVPAALSLGAIHHYPLNRRLGGPQSRYKCSGEQKNLSPFRDPKPDGPARSLVIIPTKLSQLLHGHVKNWIEFQFISKRFTLQRTWNTIPACLLRETTNLTKAIFYDVPPPLKCKYSSHYTGPDHRLLQSSQPPCKT